MARCPAFFHFRYPSPFTDHILPQLLGTVINHHSRAGREAMSGKIGTVVPMHPELKPGTLKSVLRLAKIDPEEFAEYLWL